jgi:exosortase family protein XrtF
MISIFRSEIAKFLLKVTVIYIAWYIVYELWVLPNGYIDEPLSHNIASVSAGILIFFGESVVHFGRVVGIAGYPGIEIVDGCNGIAAIGLFVGFIFAYPGSWTPRLLFTVFGIAVIYLVNVARLVALAYIQAHWQAGFDFMHDFSTTAIFYLVIFVLWMVWVNYGEEIGKPDDTPENLAPAIE